MNIRDISISLVNYSIQNKFELATMESHDCAVCTHYQNVHFIRCQCVYNHACHKLQASEEINVSKTLNHTNM